MSEKEAIARVQAPNTKESLVKDLKRLGLRSGDIVLAHASMSQLGWTVGREVTVIDALLEVLGAEGTLIMPSQTGDNSDPVHWQNPPVPETWIETIRQHMPPFDPQRSPTRSMGKVVDALLQVPGRHRSNHPQVSFCGVGQMAEKILADHQLTPGLGSGSPLQKLYDLGAKVLLLGVGYGNCTCLHLSESHLPDIAKTMNGASILVDGKANWVAFEEIAYDDGDFEQLGADYEIDHQVQKGNVGIALCRYIDLKDLCDFADEWFKEHRQ